MPRVEFSGQRKAGLLTLVTIGLLSVPGMSAAEGPPLKADTPKLDKPAGDATSDIQRALIKSKQLTGGVQKSHTPPRPGTMRPRAGLQQQMLKGNTQDQGLKAGAQSSVGIIGVKFITAAGRLPVIQEVFPGTPAAAVGLQPRDVIVAVDGIATSGLSKDEIFDLIVGTPGTSVTLSVSRNGDFQAVKCMRMDLTELTNARIRRDYLMHL